MCGVGQQFAASDKVWFEATVDSVRCTGSEYGSISHSIDKVYTVCDYCAAFGAMEGGELIMVRAVSGLETKIRGNQGALGIRGRSCDMCA